MGDHVAIKRSSTTNGLELKKRRRERYLILSASLLVILITFLGTHSSEISDRLHFANNLLFFSLLNINVILLLFVAFLVVRNIVKLVFERKKNVLGSKLRPLLSQ